MTRIALVIRKPKLRTAYRRGADFERYVMAQLCRMQPGSIVIRSAGSHSPVDLVWCAKGGGFPAGVQCKIGEGAMSAPQRQAFALWCVGAGLVPLLATQQRGGFALEHVRENGAVEPW